MSPPSSLWLAAETGPPRDALTPRLAYWEGLERAFLTHAPDGLRWGALATARPPAPHVLCERWLPLEVLRDEVSYLLDEWFGPELRRLGVDLATSSLGRARSWLDLRAQLNSLGETRLPSRLLAQLDSALGAQALLFELFTAPLLGRGLTRYAESLAAAVALVEPAGRRVRAWDAGCAAGESTWALARALTDAEAEAEVVGTTPWPLELMMAQRSAFPHDPARSADLAAAITSLLAQECSVHFAQGDLRHGPPPGAFDLISCHGVLGGVIQEPNDFALALEHLVAALSPRGVLSVQDSFRADLHEEVLSRVRAQLGWSEPQEGLFRR